MGKKADKLYKDSPTTEHNDDGKVEIVKKKSSSKGPTDADATQAGINGMAMDAKHGQERTEMMHRHVGEKMSMHAKHEAEHAAHKEGDRHDIHQMHEDEHKLSNKRHEHEMKTLHAAHEKSEGPVGGAGGKAETKEDKTAMKKGDQELPKKEKKDAEVKTG